MDPKKLPLLLLVIAVFFGISTTVCAQNGPPEYVNNAVDKIKKMITADSESAITKFVDESIEQSDEVNRSELIERLKTIRNEIHDRWKNVSIRPDPEGIRLIFSDHDPEKHLKIVLDQNGIYDLYFADLPDPITFTKTNIDSVFQELEHQGFSGVAYLQIDGEVLFEKGFGSANKTLEVPNTPKTIFGIGSRPIDFTKAAIHLLEQQGQIDQDDTIDQYFDNVPADKKTMTIRHLMTGQSGLPDFFHTSEDWDADLAWVDRETAERRILSEKLLFNPGTDQQHSHAAFGLLAALIERVAGQSYYDFLHQHFFQPANMNHTNEYGKTGDHELTDFAVGYGSQSIGLPNIPPNWGPTSWLIKGSGGMYSTLGDLLKFYDYIRSGKVLNPEHQKPFETTSVTLDGSVRGFELFNIYLSDDNHAYIFLNDPQDRRQMEVLFQAMIDFVKQEE
jgi:CubicO group peptidase (beta-lactamase class C family)